MHDCKLLLITMSVKVIDEKVGAAINNVTTDLLQRYSDRGIPYSLVPKFVFDIVDMLALKGRLFDGLICSVRKPTAGNGQNISHHDVILIYKYAQRGRERVTAESLRSGVVIVVIIQVQ